MGRLSFGHDREDDPLTTAMMPPAGETSEQRRAREQKENDAKRRSDEIDKILQADVVAFKKRKKQVKVLLLGQSESGKSTTLKNFQLAYASNAWAQDRISWRGVIQLNLVRSVNTIIDVLNEQVNLNNPSSSSNNPNYHPLAPSSIEALESNDDVVVTVHAASSSSSSSAVGGSSGAPRPGTSASASSSTDLPPHGILLNNNNSNSGSNNAGLGMILTDSERELLRRLEPLRIVQRDIQMSLGAGAEEERPPLNAVDTNTNANSNALALSGQGAGAGVGVVASGDENVVPNLSPSQTSSVRKEEFFVRSTSSWKSAFEKIRAGSGAVNNAIGGGSGRRSFGSRSGRNSSSMGADEVTETIARCREDMKRLWENEVVRRCVKEGRIKLMDSSEFYLNNVERLAMPFYSPSDEDVIRARLRTVGVQENRLVFEKGPETGQEWLIYDVGGGRSSRPAWPTFFDDMNAIIFLAPVSCFNERLSEDPTVKRLDDSINLWHMICNNKLLRNTQLICFLNKTDLLKEKLARGVRFVDFMPNYGERPNEFAAVTKFLQRIFHEICKASKVAPDRRPSIHLTSVVDTRETAVTLSEVQEGILRNHLKHLALL